MARHVVAHNPVNTAANLVTAANTSQLVQQNALLAAQNAAHLEIEFQRNREAFQAVVQPTVSPAEVEALDNELRTSQSMVATANMAYHLGYNPYSVWAWMNVRQPQWVGHVRAALQHQADAVRQSFQPQFAAVDQAYQAELDAAARAGRQGKILGGVGLAVAVACLVAVATVTSGGVFGLGLIAGVIAAAVGFRREGKLKAAATARRNMAIATVQGQLDAAAAPFTEPAPQFGAVTVDAAKA
ncbi:MAG: hypothetical protein LBR33_12225, partial [Propionibacteriaceae bacterium]|nr:hypothetical protein [Propionibacteriaceae bacterium]